MGVALRQIKAGVAQKQHGDIKTNPLTPLFTAVYHGIKGTKKFYVTDACVGCGRCKKNCQDHAIRLVDGKPQWVKKQCTKCTACINGSVFAGRQTSLLASSCFMLSPPRLSPCITQKGENVKFLCADASEMPKTREENPADNLHMIGKLIEKSD